MTLNWRRYSNPSAIWNTIQWAVAYGRQELASSSSMLRLASISPRSDPLQYSVTMQKLLFYFQDAQAGTSCMTQRQGVCYQIRKMFTLTASQYLTTLGCDILLRSEIYLRMVAQLIGLSSIYLIATYKLSWSRVPLQTRPKAPWPRQYFSQKRQPPTVVHSIQSEECIWNRADNTRIYL